MCHGATFISQIQPVGGLKGWESVLANLERVEEEGGGCDKDFCFSNKTTFWSY